LARIVDDRQLSDVRRFANVFCQLRAAYRKDPLVEQFFGIQTRIGATPDPDTKIDIACIGIDEIHSRFHAHPDARISPVEVFQMPNQPFAGEDRRDRNGQGVLASSLGRGNGGGKGRHCGRKVWLHREHVRGRQEQAVPAFEQLYAQLGLRLLHLLAHRADGHAKLVGCRLDRPEPGNRLNGPEPGEVNSVQIFHFSYSKLKCR